VLATVFHVALALLASGCVPPPLPGDRPQTRASVQRRPAQAPLMRPVRDHVSDSIPDAFPALDPPVLEEAVFAGHRENRVMRARLLESDTAQGPGEEPPMPADMGSGRLAAAGQGGGE
jgi:hypothetical protein